MALTREPSLKRASTMGLDSSTRRPTWRHDLVDDAQQVLSVAEGDGGQFEQALALDVDLLVGVDQNVGDAGILQQRLERPEAEDFVQDFVADLLLFERAEQRRLGIDQRDQRLAHFAAHPLVVDAWPAPPD